MRPKYWKTFINKIITLNRVEKIAEKGEIACFDQFLLFAQCF